jgi:fucose permease
VDPGSATLSTGKKASDPGSATLILLLSYILFVAISTIRGVYSHLNPNNQLIRKKLKTGPFKVVIFCQYCGYLYIFAILREAISALPLHLTPKRSVRIASTSAAEPEPRSQN